MGARPSQVRTQILIESVFLTILAGIIGIILGTLILFAINMATQDLSDFPYTNPTAFRIYFWSIINDDNLEPNGFNSSTNRCKSYLLKH